jgi:hypothetical protein
MRPDGREDFFGRARIAPIPPLHFLPHRRVKSRPASQSVRTYHFITEALERPDGLLARYNRKLAAHSAVIYHAAYENAGRVGDRLTSGAHNFEAKLSPL